MAQWNNRIVRYDTQPASQFIAHPHNPRVHPPEQRKAVRASLNTMGWVAPVVVNARTGYLLDGHERLWQALDIGEDTPVPFVEVDISEAEEMQFLATFDFMTYLATYDKENLSYLFGNIETDNEDTKNLLDALAEYTGIEYSNSEDESPVEDAEPQINRADELGKAWRVQRGQVWVIEGAGGRVHRVMCGDSTSAEDVGRLMDGKQADLMVTDPPYGVGRDRGFASVLGYGLANPRIYEDDWDGERPHKATFDLLMGQARACIIWGGNFFADLLPPSTHWIVWDKLQTMPDFGDCELAYTSIGRKSVKKYEVQWVGFVGKEAERYHPTQKPLKLFLQVVADYSAEGALIFDAYMESGTTLIACEQVGRVCYGMELSEGYVGVILQRAKDSGMTCTLASE